MATLSLLLPACLVHTGLAVDTQPSLSGIVDSRVNVSDDYFIHDEPRLLLFLNAEFCIDDDFLAVDKQPSWSGIVDSRLFVHDAYTLDDALVQDDFSMPVSTATNINILMPMHMHMPKPVIAVNMPTAQIRTNGHQLFSLCGGAINQYFSVFPTFNYAESLPAREVHEFRV